MVPSTRLLAVVALVLLGAACSTSRDQAKGFRLARPGDISRGRAAFLEFECNRCHEVAGANLPRPAVQRVLLGGSVIHQPSDGYLVTAIINPSFHAAQYPADSRSPASSASMPYYADRMTVQQLTDIVCYLQTRYALTPMSVKSEFP